MTPKETEAIISALIGLALSENMGDVRDAEEVLYTILEIPELGWSHSAHDSGSQFDVLQARLSAANIDLPARFQWLLDYRSESDE